MAMMMVSSLRDPERKEALPEKKLADHVQDRDAAFEDQSGPPVLAVAIAFIVLFWGAIAMGLIFWPR